MLKIEISERLGIERIEKITEKELKKLDIWKIDNLEELKRKLNFAAIKK